MKDRVETENYLLERGQAPTKKLPVTNPLLLNIGLAAGNLKIFARYSAPFPSSAYGTPIYNHEPVSQGPKPC